MNLQQLADQQGVKLLSIHNTGDNEGFVLAEKENGYMRFVTWQFGKSGFYWGNYFLEGNEARADFFNRIAVTQ
tara:strand:- start:105 stop:323 length:219 start_codon:yes stop_codon:yes gene_type:complete